MTKSHSTSLSRINPYKSTIFATPGRTEVSATTSGSCRSAPPCGIAWLPQLPPGARTMQLPSMQPELGGSTVGWTKVSGHKAWWMDLDGPMVGGCGFYFMWWYVVKTWRWFMLRLLRYCERSRWNEMRWFQDELAGIRMNMSELWLAIVIPISIHVIWVVRTKYRRFMTVQSILGPRWHHSLFQLDSKKERKTEMMRSIQSMLNILVFLVFSDFSVSQ